jgi:hypothetical protein
MALRALGRRLGKLEKARKPSQSPLVVWYGSLDNFDASVVMPGLQAGKLCPADLPEIVAAMRQWEEQGFYAEWQLDRIWKR